VAVVQYTFTHKHYIEQHSETEYTEQQLHKNKNKGKGHPATGRGGLRGSG